jgi:hypothetical protein
MASFRAHLTTGLLSRRQSEAAVSKFRFQYGDPRRGVALLASVNGYDRGYVRFTFAQYLFAEIPKREIGELGAVFGIGALGRSRDGQKRQDER